MRVSLIWCFSRYVLSTLFFNPLNQTSLQPDSRVSRLLSPILGPLSQRPLLTRAPGTSCWVWAGYSSMSGLILLSCPIYGPTASSTPQVEELIVNDLKTCRLRAQVEEWLTLGVRGHFECVRHRRKVTMWWHPRGPPGAGIPRVSLQSLSCSDMLDSQNRERTSRCL